MSNGDVQNIIRRAIRAYDMGELRDVVALPGRHANAPHVVTTEAGRFFAKALTPRCALPLAVRLRHAFVEHLVSEGLRVPRFIRTRAGEPCARDGGHVVEVQEYVDGRSLRADDPEDAARAGEALARLHLAGADFVPPGPGANRDPWGIEHDLEQLRRREQQMQTYLPAPEVTQFLQTVREALTAAAGELTQADLPTGMVHGQVRPGNLLCDAAGEVWVTDFDQCRWAPLLVDVAPLAGAFGSRAVAAYERQRALTETERGLAPTAIRLVSIHSRI